jgi:hypothetical protein
MTVLLSRSPFCWKSEGTVQCDPKNFFVEQKSLFCINGFNWIDAGFLDSTIVVLIHGLLTQLLQLCLFPLDQRLTLPPRGFFDTCVSMHDILDITRVKTGLPIYFHDLVQSRFEKTLEQAIEAEPRQAMVASEWRVGTRWSSHIRLYAPAKRSDVNSYHFLEVEVLTPCLPRSFLF